MRYVRITVTNGYCGCDEEFYDKFEDDVDLNDLDCSEYIMDYAFLEAESDFIGDEEDYECEEDYLAECENYRMGIDCIIDEISKEEYEENT